MALELRTKVEKTKEGRDICVCMCRGRFVVSTKAVNRVTAKMTRRNGYCTFPARNVFV